MLFVDCWCCVCCTDATTSSSFDLVMLTHIALLPYVHTPYAYGDIDLLRSLGSGSTCIKRAVYDCTWVLAPW